MSEIEHIPATVARDQRFTHPGPPRHPPTADSAMYDEFGLFRENAAEHGIPYGGPPTVRREFVEVERGRRLSALVWGEGPPELVLLHGNRQNAHTWDTVAMSLARPIVAIDLPGHGHSDRPGDHRGGVMCVRGTAHDVAIAIERWAPAAQAVVGMSLGGVTAIGISAWMPGLVRRVVLVDITPGVTADKARRNRAQTRGPESFATFDDMLALTRRLHPTRSNASLRRGVLHNAVQREDGRWVWRHARWRISENAGSDRCVGAYESDLLWGLLSQVKVPVLLCRGMRAGSVVDDRDEEQLLRLVTTASVIRFPQAGHNVQSDMPVELADTIRAYAAL